MMRKSILLAVVCLGLLALVLVSVPLSLAEHSMIYRARIDCLNKTSGLTETIRLTNGRGHYDAEGNEYFPGLTTSLDIERRIFKDGTTYGGSEFALGNLVATNTDGRMDQYRAYAFDGRAVVVEAATSEAGPWRPVWRGTAAYPELDLDAMTLKLSDRQEELARKKVQEAVYEGESAEIEGQKKPLIYGRVLNVPLTQIDQDLLLYQASARAGGVSQVESVFDSGVALGVNVLKDPTFDKNDSWKTSSDSSLVYYNAETNSWRFVRADYAENDVSIFQQKTFNPGDEYVASITVSAVNPGAAVITCGMEHEGTSLNIEDVDSVGIYSGVVSQGSRPSQVQNECFFIRVWWGFSGSPGDYIEISGATLQPTTVDYATRAELEAATVPHGGYHTCLAEGLIRLGSPPEGEVTADIVGTSPATVPSICRQLLLDQAGFDLAGFDDTAFTALSSANASAVGIHLAGDESFQDALDLLMGSVGAWWGFDRTQGKLTCGRVEIPVSAARSLQVQHETLGGLKRVQPRDDNFGIPVWRVTVKHTRNWLVQTSGLVSAATVFSNVGGVVSEERKVWLSKEYREAVVENADIKDDHLMSGELSFETLLLGGAASEAARRLVFYSGDRERYKLTVPMELLFDAAEGLTLDLGQALELVCNRFGLAAGKTFLVIGMTETYDLQVDKIELDLLG